MPRIHGVDLKHRRHRKKPWLGADDGAFIDRQQHDNSSAATEFDFDVVVTPSPTKLTVSKDKHSSSSSSSLAASSIKPCNIMNKQSECLPVVHAPRRRCKKKKGDADFQSSQPPPAKGVNDPLDETANTSDRQTSMNRAVLVDKKQSSPTSHNRYDDADDKLVDDNFRFTSGVVKSRKSVPKRKRNDDDDDEYTFSDEDVKKSGTKNPPTITYGMNPKTFHPVAGNMYWRKSPRNHGNRSSKNNEVIELTDSEDDSVRIVQACHNTQDSESSQLPRMGEKTKVDAVRIAIGGKVHRSKCRVSFQPEGTQQYLSFSYSQEKVQPPFVEDNAHKVLVDAISELKFCNGDDELDEKRSSPDDAMIFLAMRVTPTSSNRLIALHHYLSDEQCEETTDLNNKRRFIVIEFRNNEDLNKLLQSMSKNPSLANLLKKEGSKLISSSDISNYSSALLGDNKAEKRKRNRSMSPSEKSNKVLLVYPFDGREDVIEEAARGLNEARIQIRNDSEIPVQRAANTETESGESQEKTVRAHYLTIRDQSSPKTPLNPLLHPVPMDLSNKPIRMDSKNRNMQFTSPTVTKMDRLTQRLCSSDHLQEDRKDVELNLSITNEEQMTSHTTEDNSLLDDKQDQLKQTKFVDTAVENTILKVDDESIVKDILETLKQSLHEEQDQELDFSSKIRNMDTFPYAYVSLSLQNEHQGLDVRRQDNTDTVSIMQSSLHANLPILATQFNATTKYIVLNRELVLPQYLQSFLHITPQVPSVTGPKTNTSSNFVLSLGNLNQPMVFDPESNTSDTNHHHDEPDRMTTMVDINHEDPIMMQLSDDLETSLYLSATTDLVLTNSNSSCTTSIVAGAIEKSQICHQMVWEMVLLQELLFRMQSLQGSDDWEEKYVPRFPQASFSCLVKDGNTTIDWKLEMTLPLYKPIYILGTLKDVFHAHLELNGGPIPDSVVASLVLQMIEVISSLHKLRVVHNTLKPESFLILRQSDKDKSSATERWAMCLMGLGHSGCILMGKDDSSGPHFRSSAQCPSSFYENDLKCFVNVIHMLVYRGIGCPENSESFWSDLSRTILSLKTGLDCASVTPNIVNLENESTVNNQAASCYIDKLHQIASKDETCCFLDRVYSYEMSTRHLSGDNKRSKPDTIRFRL